MTDKDHKAPAGGYGESSAEKVNASGYRYPASHFTAPVPLEERTGAEDTGLPEAREPARPRRPRRRRAKDQGGPPENKTGLSRARKG